MSKKITLIGAGSVVFAKKLMGDILQFPALADSHICLMDIDPSRLKVAELTAGRIRTALGVNCRISATLDRTESIRGADYVITMIQVGGYKPSTVHDFEIPAKYGLKQTIADTLGVGGVFRGLRTIPKLVEIARDIESVGNPGCLLINYSNPMAMNCWGVDRAVGIPHVGLCHSVQGTSEQLADYMDLPYADITYKVAGINHMAFFLELKYKGRDVYPLLFRALEDESIRSLDAVRFEMMKRTGYYVTESSEHQAEYVPYFIHHGDAIVQDLKIPINEYIRRCEAMIASWQDEEKKLLGGETGEHFEVEPRSHEYGSFIINACETHEPTVIYGNVPNRSLITNLPAGCCVEVPCLVDGNGIQPTVIGDLPPQLAAICRTNINVQELTVEAALTLNREAVYHAVMLDPHTAATLKLDQIWAMCDELFEAHQKDGFLEEFKPVIKGTGRAYAGTGDRILAFLEMEEDLHDGTGVVRLRVVNPTSEIHELAFQLELPAGFGSPDTESAISLSVAAGETLTRDIAITCPGELESDVTLGLQAVSGHVLCKDLVLRPRRRISVGRTDGERCQLKLGGEVAAEVGFGTLEADSLHVYIRVNDSHVTPANFTSMGIRTGSGVELLVTSGVNVPVTSVFLVPQVRGEDLCLFSADGKALESGTITQELHAGHYILEADIPYEALGVPKGSVSLLVDVRCSIGALGEAHSGGTTSLSGSRHRARARPFFWELER